MSAPDASTPARDAIAAFLQHLADRDLSATTRRIRKTYLNEYLRHAQAAAGTDDEAEEDDAESTDVADGTVAGPPLTAGDLIDSGRAAAPSGSSTAAVPSPSVPSAPAVVACWAWRRYSFRYVLRIRRVVADRSRSARCRRKASMASRAGVLASGTDMPASLLPVRDNSKKGARKPVVSRPAA